MKINSVHNDIREFLGDNHVNDVKELMLIAHKLHKAKEAIYHKSFARRGLVGIWHNVARKYDAIDNLGRQDYYGITMIDSLFDVALYALKLIDAIRKLNPKVYDEWLDKVYKMYVNDNNEVDL